MFTSIEVTVRGFGYLSFGVWKYILIILFIHEIYYGSSTHSALPSLLADFLSVPNPEEDRMRELREIISDSRTPAEPVRSDTVCVA